MVDILFLFLSTVAWGAMVALPLQLATAPEGGRKAALMLPLGLLAGALAGYLGYAGRPDAAVAAEIVPLWASLPGRLLVVGLCPWLAATILAALGRDRLGAHGFRLLAAFGAGFLLLAAWLEQRLATGAGPAPAAGTLAALVLCRAALAVAAGEIVAPKVSAWPLLGALALATIGLLEFLPETAALGRALWRSGAEIAAAGGALLLATAGIPRLPPRLRRAALCGGILLAVAFLCRTAELSQAIGEDLTLPPMPPLPAF